MLIEFRVANFRSIREEQVFTLAASKTDKSLPSCLISPELPGLKDVQFLKGAAVYGANASGKTNLFEALSFLAKFVQRSATTLQPGELTGVEPFKLDARSRTEASKFEVTFISQDVRYVFGVSLNERIIIEEYLIAYPKGAPQRWYHRTFDNATDKYLWANSSTAFKQDKGLQEKTRNNTLFVSAGAQWNHAQLTEIHTWFRTNLKFLRLSAGRLFNPRFTATKFEDSSYRDRILKLLQSADVGVAGATVLQEEITVEEYQRNLPPSVLSKMESAGSLRPGKNYRINLTHTADGIDAVPLDFQEEESSGTRQLFALAGPWIDILEHGYTAFVDEIETSMHPLLVKELLKLLFCEENNPKGAQVIFTTHNSILLDTSIMRRDQIWFTEKTPSAATHLYPLTDYNPRRDEALAKGYLAGRYGGVPFIPDGLKL